MPYLSIETNKKLTSGDFTHKMERASTFISELLDKPEKWVMLSIKPGVSLMFDGNRKPAAYVELKSIGLDPERCAEYADALCNFIEKEFDIPCDRIYIEFKNVERTMFGWNRGTF